MIFSHRGDQTLAEVTSGLKAGLSAGLALTAIIIIGVTVARAAGLAAMGTHEWPTLLETLNPGTYTLTYTVTVIFGTILVGAILLQKAKSLIITALMAGLILIVPWANSRTTDKQTCHKEDQKFLSHDKRPIGQPRRGRPLPRSPPKSAAGNCDTIQKEGTSCPEKLSMCWQPSHRFLPLDVRQVWYTTTVTA